MNAQPSPSPRGLSGQSFFLAGSVLLAVVAVTAMVFFNFGGGENHAEAAVSRLRLQDIPFDGEKAYDSLKNLCALGPRRSGSAGMAAQQKLLTEYFQKLGGKVELQSFRIKHPVDGSDVPGANLLVRWNPESKDRVLFCAHYDTRPYPTLDPRNPRGPFVGANDGASGVAVLMELGREMPGRESRYGVDFALFDAEEFIFGTEQTELGQYFLGSEYFARQYANGRPGYRYHWAVLLDMVGDANLQIFQEANSVSWPDTRPLVRDIWATAARLGVREFIPKVKHIIRDDHLMLHDVGGIPACNIIDFDYPPWHTQADTPERCSALSLAKVGWVLSEWLKSLDGGAKR